MLTLLLISVLIRTFSIQSVKAEPKTWFVDDDGPADFNKIQEAVNAANPGDTIIVKAGTYIENVNVNKEYLTINSEARAEATIVQAKDPTYYIFEML